MSLTPRQPELNTTFSQTNGSFNLFTNSRTRLAWPYFGNNGNNMYFACSWNSTGEVNGGSWSASTTCGDNTSVSGRFSASFSGGVNGSATINCQVPTSGNFALSVNQSANCGSSSSFVGGNTVTQPQFNIYCMQSFVENPIITIGSSYNSSTSVQIVRLPTISTCIGRVFYIVNHGNTNFAGVASYAGEAMDGFSGGCVYLPRWACIGVTPNAAGTAWFIVSYYHGTLPGGTTYSVNGTTITSPIVTAANTGTGKTVILPNPATWGNGNLLFANTYQTNSAQYGIGAQFAIYTNGFFRQNTTANFYFSLLPAASLSGRYDHNKSFAFISDGTWWYLSSVFDGAGCYFDNSTNPGFATVTNAIIYATGLVSYFPSETPGSQSGRVYYVKVPSTVSTAYGVIVGAGGGIGYAGSTNWIRVYKNAAGQVNYSGFVMLQTNIGGTVINFPVGMYPSAY